MNLAFCPLASSSQGNSYVIKSEDIILLLDAGITGVRIEKALRFLKVRERYVKGLLITHEHIDHVKGASPVLTYAPWCNIYCSKGTAANIKSKVSTMTDERTCIVNTKKSFMIGDIEVKAFSVSHDAKEPLAFSFKKNGKKISVVTDTGKVTDEIQNAIADSDILVIESNHEENILLYGKYPYHVKRRILSDEGHLSNVAAGKCICNFLKTLKTPKVPYVFLAHLSQENNTPQQAILTIRNILEEEDFYIGKDLRLEVIDSEEVNDFIVI